MKYLTVTITPELAAAVHNVLHSDEPSEAARTEVQTWLGYVNSELFRSWSALPTGDHLKEAYRDQVWTWDDQDIYPPKP